MPFECAKRIIDDQKVKIDMWCKIKALKHFINQYISVVVKRTVLRQWHCGTVQQGLDTGVIFQDEGWW